MYLATLLLASLVSFNPSVPVGTKISNITFKDIRYLPRSLDDFKEKKAFVLVFVDKSCPVAQKYLPVLQEMETQFGSKGVQFIAVNPSPDDSILEMSAQAVSLNMKFPFVKDFGGKAAKVLGVERVPTVVILNDQRVIVYRGRVDDAVRLGGTRAEPTRKDLQVALDEVLAGKTVTTPETVVDGCVITFMEEGTDAKPVNFAEHVEPIIRKHCMDCHKVGTVAPFALLNYDQVKAKAATIAEVVREERMPPWYGHGEINPFANKRGLTDKEKETVIAWVKQGKPSGDLSKVPEVPADFKQPTEWIIGKPDLVLSTGSYDLPASGDIDYKYAILPYVFTEDTWVQDIQIKPENNKNVHHANLAYFVMGEKFNMNNFLTGYVPGGIPMQLEPGVGIKIAKGSVLGLQIHFVSTGKPDKGKVSVGLKFAKGELKKQLRFHLFVDNHFAIPPEATAFPVSAKWTVPDDIIGVGLFTHMHVRGKDMTFYSAKPNKEKEQLLMVPNYSFEWQIGYAWPVGAVKFPQGTKFECIAHFDNSTFNPYNPNPKATVREGQQTHQEMMNGFFFYVKENENLGYKMDGATGRVKKQ
ncbi:MAG: redoxin family protein [Gemmatales bacterium]